MGKQFQTDWFQGKKIVVLGLARSGLAVSKLLLRFGAKVTVNDQKAEQELAGVDELKQLGIAVITGGHPEDLIDVNVDLVVKNPGIPYTSLPIQQAQQLGIPVVTEIELAYAWSKAPLVAITGSNGKTTTTTLVGEILQAANKRPIVAGNIGTVLCEQAVAAETDNILVAELSSFQLKGTIHFRPRIACLLNVTPAHLDYHGSWEDYLQSKAKVFANLGPSDFAVLNADSKECIEIAKRITCEIVWFSKTQAMSLGAYVKEEVVYFQDQSGRAQSVIATGEVAMPGAHNLENALAAVAICGLLGASSESMRQTLATFQGVEHRLEFVTEISGIKFYNNSKATNSEATVKALEAFREPIVLIAGGLDRGVDFMELVPFIKQNVKAIVSYGQTKQHFVTVGKKAGLSQLSVVDNVGDAVAEANRFAVSGDVVLLSPSCASWDMYGSFEERGSIFKNSVHKLKTSLH
ncbi:UDP-N-acetylmuramoylalanine--D-glutamate ligase [Ammoniphilus oxalaticus]|uniref:UDP-N-acetylmuramoylalanine--D-glutamate ligase n=1 Tax=Ammoniphilus oxalaticus TaxID=66863 RepID=A0A419SJM8_9BACL|nr:UDP-N-acetylmuramoyl-L-alanine--D-glutamate ligase [Ammoniphilus oxalaticus]RKD24098.1 UDP-N-acetylmuramoylalanine--D-glutamate ligase [Ammoniphilus oxalaticus]